jgi:hypothetical protein
MGHFRVSYRAKDWYLHDRAPIAAGSFWLDAGRMQKVIVQGLLWL